MAANVHISVTPSHPFGESPSKYEVDYYTIIGPRGITDVITDDFQTIEEAVMAIDRWIDKWYDHEVFRFERGRIKYRPNRETMENGGWKIAAIGRRKGSR